MVLYEKQWTVSILREFINRSRRRIISQGLTRSKRIYVLHKCPSPLKL